MRIRWLASVPAIITATALTLVACENAVRDAGFRGPRDMHRLCLITASDDAAARSEKQRLSDWLNGRGLGLNIELVHLPTDDPNVDWSEYGIPSAPPELPVVALIGKNYGTSESFVIEHWQPTPTDEELESMRHSPARQRMHETLGKALAVILYAPGEESDEGELTKVFESVRATWVAKDLPRIEFVKFDRTDPRERTLASFAGLHRNGPSWAGVVFGRGKLMSPPLQGDEINEKRLNELVDQIYQDCNCSKPLPAIGVDLPLIWNQTLAATFEPVSEPTDKPEDPRLETLPGMGEFAGGVSESSAPETAETTGTTASAATQTVEHTAEALSGRVATVMWITFAGIGLVLLIATLVLFRKKPS